MRLARAAALALAACIAASAPASGPAHAQTEEALIVDVKRVVVPDTRAELVTKGVRVKASCSADCVLVVKLKLSEATARRLGLSNRVIGSGAAGAKADRPRWVTARVDRRPGSLLADCGCGGRLGVRIRALP
jgi:hypothetical protein